jgi:hypothetical protein
MEAFSADAAGIVNLVQGCYRGRFPKLQDPSLEIRVPLVKETRILGQVAPVREQGRVFD